MPENADPAQNPAPLAAQPTQNKLYIFFHGLFSFVETKFGVDALLPFVTDHCYRVGEFLGETELQTRPFNMPFDLVGVSGNGGKFDQNLNLVLENSPLADNQAGPLELHSRLVLPTPNRIHSFRTVDLTRFLTNPSIFSNTQVSLLPIFEYSYTDLQSILLGDHDFTLDQQQFPDGNTYATMHIFAEEDTDVNLKHPADGFTASIDLFPSVKGLCGLNGSPVIPMVDPETILAGTIFPEYEDLHFRTANRLSLMGRVMRSGGFPASWDNGNPPFGASIGSCTNVVSKNPGQ